ncbi:RloB family protein [Runella aurantiaca]|nr:RloB family protein [Runella aurantiaca]
MKTNRELIFCSGTTEYLYAKSMQMELPHNLRGAVTVEVTNQRSCDPWSLAKEAVRKKKQSNRDRNPYDNIWLFYGNPSVEMPGMLKYLGANDLNAAYCPLCLEQWFILHFEEYATSFVTRESAVAHLKKIWPQYKKNQIDAYEELKERLPMAISRASLVNNQLKIHETKAVPIFTVPNLLVFFDSMRQAG